MTKDDFKDLFDAWVDPLGRLKSWLNQYGYGIAPQFQQLFGENPYMVRKYGFLDEVGYFPNHSGQPAFQRLARVERVLQWIDEHQLRRISKYKSVEKCDLTSADSAVIESIVAFLVAHCGGLDPSVITFVKETGKSKIPDIRVDSPDCKAIIEVEHFQKYPQTQQEKDWLDSMTIGKTNPPCTTLRPYDDIHMRLNERLDSAEEGKVLPSIVTTFRSKRHSFFNVYEMRTIRIR